MVLLLVFVSLNYQVILCCSVWLFPLSFFSFFSFLFFSFLSVLSVLSFLSFLGIQDCLSDEQDGDVPLREGGG